MPRTNSDSDYENRVFVSYAWGGNSESMVNEVEEAFLRHGIRIIRDQKDLDYRGSIKSFEERIGRGQYIILMISDKYLRSEHCMHELVEVARNENVRQRIMPIVLTDARIFSETDRLAYIQYWDGKIAELNNALRQMNTLSHLSNVTAKLELYESIRSNFDHISALISDMNVLTPELHRTDGFSTLIRIVQQAVNLNPGVGSVIQTGSNSHDLQTAELHEPNDEIPPDSIFYIEREADVQLRRAILGAGAVTMVNGGPKMGKTSLLKRGQYFAQINNKTEVFLSFSELEGNSLDEFLRSLASSIGDELDIDGAALQSSWNLLRGSKRNFNKFMEDVLLPQVDGALVMILDDAHKIAHTEFEKDFFEIMRTWNSKIRTEKTWRKLNVIIATSTHPALLITGGNSSTFNQGREIFLEDFDDGDVGKLNLLYGSPATPEQISQIKSLIGYHPHLVHLALFHLTQGVSIDELCRLAMTDRGPFYKHLLYIQTKVMQDVEIRNSFRDIVQKKRVPGGGAVYRLLGLGLLRPGGERYEIRYPLYQSYFQRL